METDLVFVAREQELARLDELLQRALAEQGSVCFVTGEAGSGKTALVAEFARRAQEGHPDLLVAVGQCDAQTGAGDAYLPLREILTQLSGDVSGKLAQGGISQENASRLQRFLQYSGNAIVELGPDLLGVFIPAAGLLTRAGAYLAEKAGWLDRLQKQVERDQAAAPIEPTGIRQENIFEQYTNVLLALAAQQPLLLVLDDLQWADGASIDLLFRLGRRLGGSRILLLGTYRPDEIALGRAGGRHPLEKVLGEFKRYLGDICIELDALRPEARRSFVEALLDTEPNRLSAPFRQALLTHTNGHALFTIELLRAMQERDDLVQDPLGNWVPGERLDWSAFPARVEGVIQERIGRLGEELCENLSVASVEGESFTAETVAQVRGVEVRRLVRQLSGELEKQHRLVASQGVKRLDEQQRLSLYRFQHNLFQRYLYRELDEVERSFLHEDVGRVLETLYGEQADQIAVQLAHHFGEAGVREKAAHYLGRAGQMAAARKASDEALAFLDRALAWTPAKDLEEHYELLLTRKRVYALKGDRTRQAADLESLSELAEQLDDDRCRAEITLGWAHYHRTIGDYPSTMEVARRAIELARRVGDQALEANGYLQEAAALWHQGQFEESRRPSEACVELARSAGVRELEAEALHNMGVSYLYQGRFSESMALQEQAVAIYRELGSRHDISGPLNSLGGAAAMQGNYDQARNYCEEGLQYAREVGDRRAESVILSNSGELSIVMGDYAAAAPYLERALAVFEEIGDRRGNSDALAHTALLAHLQGDDKAALEAGQQSLALSREINNRMTEGYAQLYLGHAQGGLEAWEAAAAAYRESVAIFEELEQKSRSVEAQAGLARVALAQGDLAQAMEHAEPILDFLAEGSLQGITESIRVYLTCFRTLDQAEDPRAADVLETAHQVLQDQAARLGDAEIRGQFLEKISAHRELRESYA